jgi:hypothetical protein
MRTFWAGVLGSFVGSFFVGFLTNDQVLWIVMQMPWAVWSLVALALTGVFLLVAGITAGVLMSWRRA